MYHHSHLAIVQKLINHPMTHPAHQNLQIAISQGTGHLISLAILKIRMGTSTKNKLTKQKAQHLNATTFKTPIMKNGK